MKRSISAIIGLPLLSLMIVSVSGCASTGIWVKPIYIAEEELSCMTRETKQQILTHNETWEANQ